MVKFSMVKFKECLLQRILKGKVQGKVITNFPMLYLVNFIQYRDPELGSDLEVEDITLVSYEEDISTFEWIIHSTTKGFEQIWDALYARVEVLNEIFNPLDSYLKIVPLYRNWKSFRIIFKDNNLFTIEDDLLIQTGFSHLIDYPSILYPAFVKLFRKCAQNRIFLNSDEMEDFLQINIEYPSETELGILFDIKASLNKPEQEYIRQIYSENPGLLQIYEERYQSYTELYSKLQLLFQENNLLTPTVRLILE